MRKILAFLLLTASAFAGTITGTVQTPSGGPVANATITLALSQPAILAGTSTLIPTTSYCYTSSTGNVVGVNDPLSAPSLSYTVSGGTLPAGTYYVKIVYTGATGTTLASPEAVIAPFATNRLTVTAPINPPQGATGYSVYIGTSSGTETLQGTVTGFTNYVQGVPLVSGSALPTLNTTTCTILFNDTLIPSFTGYQVSIFSKSGALLSGYPQKWYLSGGASGTINLSMGTPLYSGTVVYPQAILAGNANPQSVAGNFAAANFTGPVTLPSNPTIALGATPKQYDDNSATALNVKLFGALGDGVTCDTAAFNAALATGRKIFVPHGTFNVNLDLGSTGFVEIMGDGINSQLQPCANQTATVTVSGASRTSPANYIRITNVNFVNTQSRTLQNDILINYGAYISLEDVNFYSNATDAVSLQTTVFVWMTRNHFFGLNSDAKIYANWQDVSFYVGGEYYLDQLTFQGTGVAIKTNDVVSLFLSHSNISALNGDAIVMGQDGNVGSDKIGGMVFTDNDIDSNAGTGIDLNPCRNVTITGNWISTGRTNLRHGIKLTNCDNSVISNNNLFWNGDSGVSLTGGTHNTISNNVSSRNINNGIRLASETGDTVSGNTTSNDSYAGIGASQLNGIWEDANSTGDIFVGNVATGNTLADYTLAGINDVALNADGVLTTPTLNASSAAIQNQTTTNAITANSIQLLGDPQVAPSGASNIGGNNYACPTAITGTPTTCLMANVNGTVMYIPLWSNSGGGGGTGVPSWWPSIPAGATVFANLQNAAGNPGTWTLASRAASGSASCNGTSSSSLTFNVSSPAMKTGAALQLTNTTAGSSGGCNQLAYRHLGAIAAGNSTITNMLEDFYAYVIPGSGAGFEWDPDLGDGTGTSAHAYKASYACYTSGGGKWNVYDSQNHLWVATTYACNWNGAGASTLHHFQSWQTFDQTNHQYVYKGLAIDGVDVWTPSSHAGLTATTYNACGSGCSGNGSLGANINVEFQSDLDNTNSTAKSLIDKVTLTVW